MVARRRMAMADIKEILVGWDVGESVSAIARRLGYTRVTAHTRAHLGTKRPACEHWIPFGRAHL